MFNFKKLELCIFDLDGVLTDGKYLVSTSGETSKSFYTRDFYAIEQLLRNDVKVAIISQSDDIVINTQINRISAQSEHWRSCIKSSKLFVMTGIQDKFTTILNDFCRKINIYAENMAYMGDAENDLDIMKKIGYTACPSDAIEEVKNNSNFVCNNKGGNGAVYEFVQYVLKERKK